MSTVYTKCEEDVTTVLNSVLQEEYPELVETKVTFSCVFAERYDKETGEAISSIKVHGVPAAAKISVSTLVERSRGLEDVKLTIDRGVWSKSNDDNKKALIDHELHHLVLKEEDDDLGRPKLKLQPHDLVVGAFTSIIKRYGDKCIDSQQIEVVNETVKAI